MNILVTGSAGFVGRNLVENLKNIRDGKNRTRPNIHIHEIYEYDRDGSLEQLDAYCRSADFVFHLAGVNRPKNPEEFKEGNVGSASLLLDALKRHGNSAPLLLASSIQAALSGRFGTSQYGLSKRRGEELFFRYAADTKASVYVYRFPNLAGKWARPDYNSAVATFCHNIAHDLPVRVDNPDTELELLFIDDLMEEMYDALEGHPHRCNYAEPGKPAPQGSIAHLQNALDSLKPYPDNNGKYCYAPITHKAALGYLVETLRKFHAQPETLLLPSIPKASLEYKLYSMYLSYLPADRICVDLKSYADSRGSFTEVLKTEGHGQLSVNVSLPGAVKGEHWHDTKWEIFIVVSGHGLIQERKIGGTEILEFEVRGDKLQAVYMLPGYTHNIRNLSSTEPMVTLMWANEEFDPERPDTFREAVRKKEIDEGEQDDV